MGGVLRVEIVVLATPTPIPLVRRRHLIALCLEAFALIFVPSGAVRQKARSPLRGGSFSL